MTSGGSDAPSWRKTQVAGKDVIAVKNGDEEEVTSPVKVREESSAGDLAKRALFTEGNGGGRTGGGEPIPMRGLMAQLLDAWIAVLCLWCA